LAKYLAIVNASAFVVERLLDAGNPLLNLMERECLIDEILDDAIGFGPLGVLFHDDRVREIRVESPRRMAKEFSSLPEAGSRIG
jgi:Flp pilus assembly CpaF family ATPase